VRTPGLSALPTFSRGERGRETYRFTAAFDGKTSKFRIKQLEEAGVTHPDMEKIKALLTTEAGQ